MRPVTLSILGGIAIASAVAAVVFLPPADDAGQARLGERLFPDLATRAGDVQAIELQRPDGTIVLRRAGETWVLPERGGYAADTGRIRQLFVEVSELRTLEAKTRSKDVYASLEVEDRDAAGAKSTRVAFKTAQGQDIVALLAGKNRFGRGGGGDDAVYVRRAGDAQAWLAKGRLTVNRDAVQWLERGLSDVARERVREARIDHADGTSTVVSRPSPAERDFVLADVPEDRKAKTGWEIGSVAAAFEKLEFEDVRKADGVAIPAAALTATTTTFDGLEISARLVEIEGTPWAALSAKAAPPAQLPEGGPALKSADEVRAEAERIQTRLAPWLFKLPVFNLENMRRKIDDLLEPKDP
jgi:hypothetical protein